VKTLFCFALGLAIFPGAARPADPDDGMRSAWHGRIEVKREATSRGTPEETTKTALKIDTYLDGPVSLFRIDMPFPDDKESLSGSPFNPKVGDLKLRTGFRGFRSGAYSFPSFVEVTFPTAHPDSKGAGKYQGSAAIRMIGPLELALPPGHQSRFEIQLQHVQSFAGDPGRADIRHTKAELTAYDEWRETASFKAKLKPVIDWEKDGRSGATLELEAGWFFRRSWKTWLMVGARVWGRDDIASTYNTRLELGISRIY
jgi:hypothetical protein